MSIFSKVVLWLCLLIFTGTMISAAEPEITTVMLPRLNQSPFEAADSPGGPEIPGILMKGGVFKPSSEFLLTSRTTSIWQSENWLSQNRTTYIYNSRNQVYREIYEVYSTALETWRYNYRVTYYYNSEHEVDLAVADYWNGMSWIRYSNTEVTYDSEGRVIQQFQEGNENTLQTFTYDSEGRLIEFILQRTEDLLDPWENYIRYLNSYEGTSLYPSENVQQEWVGDEWVNRDRYSYTYHHFGMYLATYHDNWAGEEWTDYGQSFFTYGENDWLGEILNQRWYGDAWHDDTKVLVAHDAHGNVLSEVTMNKMLGDWGYASRNEYVWEEVSTDAPEVNPTVLQAFALAQNSPNPFNASTAISFTLPTRQDVSIRVYNILGQEVKELVRGNFPAGEHTVIWDGNDGAGRAVSSGIYFYTINTAEKALTRKMVLLK